MKRLANCLSTFTFQLRTIKSLIGKNLFSRALKDSTFLRCPDLTDGIYALFIKSGSVLDPFLSASLITHFSHSGDFTRAAQLLRDTNHPDTVVYNSIISGFANFGQSGPVFELCNDLRQLGLRSDAFTMSSLIKSCDSLIQNEIAHGVSIKTGCVSSVFLISGLIDNYAKLNSVNSAARCFHECLVLDSVVWTAMINGYVWNDELDKARDIFVGMRSLGLELNEYSLTSVLGAIPSVREGEQVHGIGLKMGFLRGGSTPLNNALMNMYCRGGCNFDAIKVFDEIPNPDVVSWAERIAAASDGVEAFAMFKFCLSRGLEINEYTMVNVLSTVECPNLLPLGKQIHAFCYKVGYLFLVYICNALISMYGRHGWMDDARSMFCEMDFCDNVTWNAIIAGYAENGFTTQAIEMFSRMRDLLFQPNEYSLASILEAVSNSLSPVLVMQIHPLAIKLGFMSDGSMLSCLITAYGKCSCLFESKRLFGEIVRVDSVHLNAMAGVYANAGCHVDVLKLFQSSWSSFLDVDSVTFCIVLKACGILTGLEHGRMIHSLAIRFGVHTDLFIESAVIDVYCKCGSIEDAEKAFRDVYTANLAAWNALIMGYAQCGCYHKVCNILEKMPGAQLKPDEITYLGVLSSCCHAGLVDEAHYHFNSMFELHGLIPRLEHYACVVDVLGRVGLLEDAMKTIDQMPICPDARIWQILLSACNIHRKLDLGKIAATKLHDLEPENDSRFVLLSHLYASAGLWGAVGELRREMKEKLVWKAPGSSWIQVKGTIHRFFADDTSHPESEEVYRRLKSLKKQMLNFLDAEHSFDKSVKC